MAAGPGVEDVGEMFQTGDGAAMASEIVAHRGPREVVQNDLGDLRLMAQLRQHTAQRGHV